MRDLGDGVVGGQAGVGVRRHLVRSQPLRKLDHRALAHEHVLRESAVERQPGELVVHAMHVVAAPALHAQATAERRIQDHCVARRDRRHQVADLLHPARVLVSEHERKRHSGRLHQALDRMHVGGAHAGAADPDQHLVGPPHLGGWILDQLQRPVVLAHQGGSHGAIISARRDRRSTAPVTGEIWRREAFGISSDKPVARTRRPRRPPLT